MIMMNNWKIWWEKSFFHKYCRFLTPAILAVLLIGLIAGYLLFVPPYGGYANNGDFERAIYVSGLYVLPDRPYYHFDYLVRQFGIMQYFNENGATLFSSQPLIIKTAIMINKLFFSRTIFDIRFLGALHYIFYLGGVYLLTEALTFRLTKARGYLVALLVVFILGDSSLTLYFNSFFAEATMLITFIYIFATTLLLVRHRYQHSWPLYLIFGLSTVVFVTVKQQNAPLAFLIALVAFSFIFWIKRRGRRILVVASTLAIMGTGVATYALITKEFNDINQYQSMTRGVLLNAEDSGKSLKEGGINQQYALLRGLPYFETYMPVSLHGEKLSKELLQKYNFVWILRYYLKHLNQFVQLLDLAARDTQIVQLGAVGDYEKSAGKPAKAQNHYFTLYSNLKRAFYPRVYAFYILFFVVMVGLYSYGAYQGFRHQNPGKITKLALVICCCATMLAVCLISIIGDGDADLAKHLFMAPVCLDLLTLLLISDINGRSLFGNGNGETGLPTADPVNAEPAGQLVEQHIKQVAELDVSRSLPAKAPTAEQEKTVLSESQKQLLGLRKSNAKYIRQRGRRL
ncbi:glycan biosynthesis hexose transferase WsfD [Lapidilactobacillus luobeiensis]|uniref:glycan biosynthesis hexose transferase WsfD n=1 Tax=Lapidilactobacillus luobeiensis TaxID=2950371 RepID=UPI0021C35DF9|nr:hypothetical protein [Lapidilactobacillus luobeiensis]